MPKTVSAKTLSGTFTPDGATFTTDSTLTTGTFTINPAEVNYVVATFGVFLDELGTNPLTGGAVTAGDYVYYIATLTKAEAAGEETVILTGFSVTLDDTTPANFLEAAYKVADASEYNNVTPFTGVVSATELTNEITDVSVKIIIKAKTK